MLTGMPTPAVDGPGVDRFAVRTVVRGLIEKPETECCAVDERHTRLAGGEPLESDTD